MFGKKANRDTFDPVQTDAYYIMYKLNIFCLILEIVFSIN